MRHVRILVATAIVISTVAVGAGVVIPPPLRLIFCDVGQGDATLIRTPSRQDILIDGGPDAAVLDCLGKYLPPFDRTLELVVATHPDSDHVVGLSFVAQRYSFDTLLVNGKEDSLPAYQELLAAVQRQGGQIITAEAGQEWHFDELVGTVLWPPPGFGATTDDNNAASVTMRFVAGQSSVLLTGDLPAAQERSLVASHVDLVSTIAKAGHHGSATATDEQWLAAVRPRAMVISAGQDNRYGHPALDILVRLQQQGITIYRTDRQGDVVWRQHRGQLVPCQQWWCVVW